MCIRDRVKPPNPPQPKPISEEEERIKRLMAFIGVSDSDLSPEIDLDRFLKLQYFVGKSDESYSPQEFYSVAMKFLNSPDLVEV